MPPRVAAGPKLAEPAPDVSLLDLPPDLFETWQERACIMHFDGRLPWRTAEALALADVFRHAAPVAAPEAKPGPLVETVSAEKSPVTVQGVLFAEESAGPYAGPCRRW